MHEHERTMMPSSSYMSSGRSGLVVFKLKHWKIVNRLSDMDTTLQKLKLRSDFSFDASGFSEVPSDIMALEEELAQFQIASDNIREAIASPFDTGE